MPISPSTELLDMYVALLEEKHSLLRALARMTESTNFWAREAKRRHRDMRRLMLVAVSGWAGFIFLALTEVLR